MHFRSDARRRTFGQQSRATDRRAVRNSVKKLSRFRRQECTGLIFLTNGSMRISSIRARAGIVAHIIIILDTTYHRLDSRVADHQKIRQKLEEFGWTQASHGHFSFSCRSASRKSYSSVETPRCDCNSFVMHIQGEHFLISDYLK